MILSVYSLQDKFYFKVNILNSSFIYVVLRCLDGINVNIWKYPQIKD